MKNFFILLICILIFEFLVVWHIYHNTILKFDSRTVPTIFVGYPSNQKGYKLYDPVSKTFSISRHVVFQENIFPYSDRNSDSTSFPYFPFPLGLLDDTSMSPLDVTAYQPSSDDINLDSSLSPADLSPSPSPD